MCGIAGVLGSDGRALAERMAAAMEHRGPDDSGLWTDDASGVALSHRRLSIIDVTSCAHQPMAYADGRYHGVFNGEIYNYVEIRSELTSRGHRFISASDTEVLLAAYAEWGAECVRRLRGMFAFAIHDRNATAAGETALFLARDRFGIKPLYFASTPGAFAFASELKAILGTGIVANRVDRESLWWYISLGSVPQPHTLIHGVEQLRPGHVMTVTRDGTCSTTRYWDLREASRRWSDDVRRLDRREAAQRVRALLEDATRMHMVADVPVGAFLSGGIDSTAVVGLMSRLTGTRIRTFALGFADAAPGVADERAAAELSAAAFDCEHTEVVVDGRSVAARFDELVRAIDQPSLDGTNSFLVAEATARTLKVALSGLGGDELFAGYPHFRRLRRADAFARRLGPLVRLARHVPGRLLPDGDFIAEPVAERYAHLRRLVDDGQKLSLLARWPDTTRKAALSSLYEPLVAAPLSSIARTTYVEANRYLPDTLLRDVDAMSMASSLEVRPVLLDHPLAEFVFAVRDGLKVGTENKPLLVDAVRDLLPPAVVTRPKTGFELPLTQWLVGPLRDRALEAFASQTAQSVFSRPFLDTLRVELSTRNRPHVRTWAYLVLIEWLRVWETDL